MKSLPLLLALLVSAVATAQYNHTAGTSAPKADRVQELRKDASGESKAVWVDKPVIKRFFDSGRGLYLWGDNTPYSGDANVVATALFGTSLTDHGHWGEKVVGLHRKGNEPGVIQDHLLTTGREFVYEGHTTTALDKLGPFKPLLYGSDGKITAGYYDQNGKRAIIDGGFTRLYLKWDTAGTGRYVKNAAAWLANAERFGAQVVAAKQAPEKK